MYKDVGKKIKVLAQVLGWVFLAGGVISGILLCIDWDGLVGALCIVGGCIMFCFSWPLYGFGQVVEDVSELRKKSANPSSFEQTPVGTAKSVTFNPQQISRSKQSSGTPVSAGWECTCGRMNSDYTSTCVCGVSKYDAKAAQNK